jgi:spermidine synthase
LTAIPARPHNTGASFGRIPCIVRAASSAKNAAAVAGKSMLIKRKSIEAQANRRRGPGRDSDEDSPRPARKPKFAPVTLSEENGVRFLHFGTEWIQGAMRIRKPDWIELEYVQQLMAWMLFVEQPRTIVQLGLGAGSLTKFCYRQFPQTMVTAVELNPSVIAICHAMFKLPQEDERLTLLEMDALDFVSDPARHGSIDALQVDLYDAAARGPVLDTPEFYQACAACLAPGGVMTVNLFGDHPSYEKNLRAIRHAFGTLACLTPLEAGNVIVLAFKAAPDVDAAQLYQRADRIRQTTGLPATSWVNGLKVAQLIR